jgi:hypothetical protein
VMRAAYTTLLFRLWISILLSTIGFQAVGPVSAPLERVTGSAFSAGTADVAFLSSRPIVSTSNAAIPTPPRPPESVTQLRVEPQRALALPIGYARPPARAPPPREWPARLPDLRGPPIS